MRAAAATATLLAAHAAVNARLLRTPPPPAAFRAVPRVSVLIPARNEARTVGGCVEAVLRSTGVVFEVLVLDDGSDDATADIVLAIASRDRRVRLLSGDPLPQGWLGKPHACAQLAAAATGEALAFVDADTTLAADALARTVALLRSADLGMVCPYPRQETGSWSERLVQPLLQWSWLTFLPLRAAERAPAPTLVAANGQFLVCRRDVYDDIGGHAAIRGAVLDDLELARAAKRAGHKAAVADGTTLATCRMYEGWPALRDGYSKNLWAVTRTPAGGAALAAFLLWLYVAPPAVAVARLLRRRPGAGMPALAYGAGVAGRMIAARRTGGRLADAPAHPLSVAMAVGLQLRSLRLHRAGRLTWKGRPIR